MSTAIRFPFDRNRRYAIGELRAFEAAILAERQRDASLSKALRDPVGCNASWMRLRNKETVPLRVFADQIALSDEDQFMLMPEGHYVDARIFVAGGGSRDIQITVTAPRWSEGGYQHHLFLKALNEHEFVVGYPPFNSDGEVAVGETDAFRNEDRDRACRLGLSDAVANKVRFDGRGCTLIVFAQEFYVQLLDVSLLSDLVDSILEDHALTFDSVCVFDSRPGFFVERPSRTR